jgi:putative photosynthetic complex assembly protein
MTVVVNQALPTIALRGLFALVLGALLLATAGRAGWLGESETHYAAAMISQHALVFRDGNDGSVHVIEPESNNAIAEITVGNDGFIRSVMRGMARERKRRSLPAEPPFLFTHWADGRFSLSDPLTGRTVELRAFGADNAGAFERLVASAGSATERGVR